MFAAATSWLERNAEAINSINVFPVPDGDTGTNMYLTMRATMDEAYESGSDAADVVAKRDGEGRADGRARQLRRHPLADPARLRRTASPKKSASTASTSSPPSTKRPSAPTARSAIPSKGTILTVMRAVAAAARRRSRKLRGSLKSVLAAPSTPPRTRWRRRRRCSPCCGRRASSMPAARGFTSCWRGRCATCAATSPRWRRSPSRTPSGPGCRRRRPARRRRERLRLLHASSSSAARGWTRSATLERMLELGDSVLVVGDETLLRVHLHTSDPRRGDRLRPLARRR